ncbi:DUF1127 domain-containing protein [Pseudomonas stutzeri]|uniref:YjiS-like domain-containing protein n=1 Tax=Stutzerimonas stutzeri TaxID=316 RepID=A0A2N8RX71_STUST|nr:DUF1127 domain-containing protein [Stutzerimonas stutzeri]MCQ4297100.1 DUF1127 domain-containing protein [Stutzerimonas stutzeri]PNF78976.1 hypothetical protein CXK92_18870 [Stutzerimonas stutzeri]
MDRTLPRLYVVDRARRNWQQILQTLLRWHRNSRTRQQLAQLDERQLADVGISHSMRATELEKPFWR